MNCAILSWNTRGLGRPEKRRSVVDTINSCGAKVVFLQETKISGFKSDIIRRMCCHRNNETCGLVNVYAPNDPVERGCFLEGLSDIIASAQVPVIVHWFGRLTYGW
ncbi:hypothetical protein V6N13_076226 [Hibiscus sabdariffa]